MLCRPVRVKLEAILLLMGVDVLIVFGFKMIESLFVKIECTKSLALGLHLITAVLPIVISAAVAYMSYSQLQTNRLKLKLGLYNRRFNVYQSALNYYLDFYYKATNKNQSENAGRKFVSSYRESKFLFDEKSGVYDQLTVIKDLIANPNRDFQKLEDAMNELEEVMLPALNFRKIHS